MNLKSFLNRKGMNQRQLAEAIGCTAANVNKWFSGEGRPSYEVCKKLFEMGISVEELFGVQYDEGSRQDALYGLSPAEIVRQGLLELASMQQAEAAGRAAMLKRSAQTQSQNTPGTEKK